jgi:hypothetical protein
MIIFDKLLYSIPTHIMLHQFISFFEIRDEGQKNLKVL